MGLIKAAKNNWISVTIKAIFRKNHAIDLEGYAHYLHHRYFECNYADGILPLDRWFGTLHDGTQKAHKEMMKKLKEKSHKKTKMDH